MAAKPQAAEKTRSKLEYERRLKNLAAHVATAETRRRVEIMVFADTPIEMISRDLGITLEVLRRRYYVELKYGKQRIATELKTKYIAAALDGDKVALSRVALTIANFGNEPPGVPPAGSGNGIPDLSKLSEEQLLGLLVATREDGAASGDRTGIAATPGARDLGTAQEQPTGKMH